MPVSDVDGDRRGSAADGPSFESVTPAVRSPLMVSGPWLILAIPIVSGLLLRTYRLGDISYWYDESFSWKLTTFPVAELLERLAGDSHPPLYFLLLKAWAGMFGDSPAALRSLSAVFAAVTVAGTFLMVREAYRPHGDDRGSSPRDENTAAGAGLLAAAFVSLSPLQVHWATQMRMYSLATAGATISTWLLLVALRSRQTNWRAWLAYSVTATALLYTHYFGLFSVASQMLFAAGYLAVDSRKRAGQAAPDNRFFGLAVSLGLILSAFSYWLPVLLRQRSQVHAGYWIGRLTLRQFADSFYAMFAHSEAAAHSHEAALLAVGLCLALALALAWRGKSGDWLMLICGGGPIMMAAAVSLCDTRIFVTRYLLCAHLFLLAGIAGLIRRIEPGALRVAAGALVVAQCLWIDYHYVQRRAADADQPGARAAVTFIDSERRPGELVISPCPMLTPTLEGHSRSREGWRTFRRGYEYPHYQGTAVVRAGEYVGAEELDSLEAARVWVVEEKNWSWGRWPLAVPEHWKPGRVESFADIYGAGNTVEVHLYYPSGP